MKKRVSFPSGVLNPGENHTSNTTHYTISCWKKISCGHYISTETYYISLKENTPVQQRDNVAIKLTANKLGI